jgi:hypothetical protein
MSNTWDYRFAFRLNGLEDIPEEFRSAYDRLVRANGLPVFGLFTPCTEEHVFVVSRRLPPRVIFVFPRSFVLLSLDTSSNAVNTFDLSRTDFLGYGFAEFMLNCWFTVYHGHSGDGKTVVRLPSRAGEHYWELNRFLLDWCGRASDANSGVVHSLHKMPEFPAKFLNFMKTHPEYGKISEFFFQPAMDLRGKRHKPFANLLLSISTNGILVLNDQSHHHRSEAGLEMTFLPLDRVQSSGWIESSQDDRALLRIDLHGEGAHSQMSWHVLTGLKPYAFRWIRAVNDAAQGARQERLKLEKGSPKVTSPGDVVPISS